MRLRAQEAQRDEHAPVEHLAVVGDDAQLAVVAGQRQQQLGELDVVVVAEGGVGAAEAAEVAAQARRRLDRVRRAEVVGVRGDDDDGLGLADGARRASPWRSTVAAILLLAVPPTSGMSSGG